MKKALAIGSIVLASGGTLAFLVNMFFLYFIAPEMDYGSSDVAMNVVRVLGFCQGTGIGIGCVQIGISTLIKEPKT